ncbi:2-amino-4-hydroxy-6-hydroxymethyldihydropteridine diphosphokinase [Maritimibacter alkaliphilus HTCC2654]|uniref:2-amino-4-hydroxy-6-hydroxymethyldihydropteridine pyrophosphokinase n=1 Tax=Maritimibacter alkaliphilus HTCC2654 TaxID=314271 RepID=A3VBA4_9RHOB|nr:2-amino-4-hydroxy-6-hydroxymethyldihydropteridine pyrophosphokinase [Rhodobacterales bacterium HTCC2654] [Maritimibacter alkaliphilus HTCC2654]TYP82623.1 2-amino-4-hydroxy-6-hydroxymethyldihydropteridine diphosphokinase [Maritimibacter alkaliphilus HTCC2654]
METIQAAISSLDDGPFEILARSRLYVSPFVPKGAEPDVVNAVVEVSTPLDPAMILARLHKIETSFDRIRRERWTNRTLDLDLLTLDQMILPDQPTLREWVNLPFDKQKSATPEELILPHPRLQDRAFVLVPAADIAPDWRHPLLDRTIREMLDALPDDLVSPVRPLDP